MSASLAPNAVDDDMNVEEFLAWSEANDGRWELVDGQPRAMTAANRTHGTIQGNLAAIIHTHLRAKRPDCFLVAAPGVVPKQFALRNMRVPDLGVTCTPYTTEEAALSAPVLAIEILSPGNRAKTWSNVWTYVTIPSVLEILIVHTAKVGVDLLRRQADGSWPDKPTRIKEGEVSPDSIGLTTTLADIYYGTLLALDAQ